MSAYCYILLDFFNLSLLLFFTGYVAGPFQCVLCCIFGGIFMDRLILLFYAKASVLCFNLSLFIRTTAFSLSASRIVIVYGMNVVFEISDFHRNVADIFALMVCCAASIGCYRPISTLLLLLFGLLRV